MNTYLLIYLFLLHFLGDFILQTNWMSQNKSKQLFPLFTHVYVYSLTLFIGLIWISVDRLMSFVVLNCVIHFIIDFYTSKLNSRLNTYDIKQRNLFWWGIGFDQYLHSITLLITSSIL